MSAGIMTAPDVLRRSLFNRIDIVQRHLDGEPHHRHPETGIVARHLFGNWEVHRAVNMPPINRETGKVP